MSETGSDAYKLRRLEHKALDVPVYRELVFKSLEPKFQHFLLDQSILDQDELPALGFFENEETWLMATTRRVVWSRPGFRKELSYKHIKSDGMTEMDKLFKEKNPNHEERAKEIARIKGGSPWFFWEDENGTRHEALLPPGGQLFAIWNLVRYLMKLDSLHPIKDQA